MSEDKGNIIVPSFLENFMKEHPISEADKLEYFKQNTKEDIENLQNRVTKLEKRVNELEKSMKEIGKFIEVTSKFMESQNEFVKINNQNLNAIMAEIRSISGQTNQLNRMLLGH